MSKAACVLACVAALVILAEAQGELHSLFLFVVVAVVVVVLLLL